MQLVDGKTYKARNGRTYVVEFKPAYGDEWVYPFYAVGGCSDECWTAEGAYCFGDESPHDLVEEVTPESLARAHCETQAASPPDAVNHPSHYNQHPSGVECITVTEHLPHNIGNVVKYLWRAGLKENAPTDQDYNKAVWYLLREMRRQGVKLTVAQEVIEGLR